MTRSDTLFKSLIMILLIAGVTACSNSVPTVETLMSPKTPLAAKDSKNFVQLSAASQREVLSGGYKGTVRVSQPLGRLEAKSAGGHKLQGTVTFQR